MAHTYAGNPASFPADIPIPDDGDEQAVASIVPALEALADRTAFVQASTPRLHYQIVTATTASAWTAPTGVTVALLVGCGGGGGGGAGANPSTNITTISSAGGGGGAGSTLVTQVVETTPGTAYDVTIGAGGTGGTHGSGTGAAGNDGANGGDTTFAIHSGSTLATFPGAGGGQGGKAQASLVTPTYGIAAGGLPSKGSFRPGANSYAIQDLVFGGCPGSGGEGVDKNGNPRAGSDSEEGYAGGAGGASSIISGNAGPGGGGGGGPAGVGTAGADGGGLGAPSNATSAGANTGAGGGGGGGTLTGNGSSGGDGGSGFLIIVWSA